MDDPKQEQEIIDTTNTTYLNSNQLIRTKPDLDEYMTINTSSLRKFLYKHSTIHYAFKDATLSSKARDSLRSTANTTLPSNHRHPSHNNHSTTHSPPTTPIPTIKKKRIQRIEYYDEDNNYLGFRHVYKIIE